MKKAYGFTIVELLIVIVVIAILAALSYVGYVNMSNKAYDSVVASDAAAIARKLETTKVDLGHYPVSEAEFPADLSVSKGSYATNVHNVMYCLNKVTDSYNLAMVSKSGKGYWVVSGQVHQVDNATSNLSLVCGEVGATWSNDSVSQAIHGYNSSTGVWYAWWSLTK